MKNPLKVKRQQLKISKEEIAKRLNTKLQNIKEWECGRVNPKSIIVTEFKSPLTFNIIFSILISR